MDRPKNLRDIRQLLICMGGSWELLNVQENVIEAMVSKRFTDV